jgi:hypothetical protein
VGRTFNGTNLDILILAYDNTGTLLWSRVIDRGGNDVPSAAVLGPGDRIFFTGRTETTPGTEVYDFYTVCYSSTGSVIWSDIYDGTGSGNDESQAIAFVPLRDGPVISGKSDRDASAGENMDMVTIQYDANGNRVWTNVFGGNAQSDDIPDALAVKPNSQVYLVGHTNTSTALLPNYDLYFAAINPYNGNTIYSDLYNGVADSSDIPNTIVLRNNDIFIAGSCFAPNQQRNILVLKYAGSVDGIDENLPGESVFRFYPIPATDRLDFRSDIVLPDDASLSVSDITGKTLLQHDLNRSSEATLPLTGLAAGSYTVVLSADGKVLFRKKFLHLSVK